MVDQEEAARIATSKQQAICEECKLKPSKYRCPGCSVRSCSLPCVKAHKHRTGCTGKRKLTEFVPLSEFDENLLISDYNMLEEVKRIAEAARRTRAKLCAHPHPQYRLPIYLKGLRNAAASRKTKLLFLPSGMSKREKNKSRYDHRKKFIQWTIEWRFHSTDVALLDHEVHEDRNLCSVIENHLKPSPWNNKLRQFTEEQLDSLKFFVRTYPKGTKSPFRELDIKAPIRQQFANLVILEYPVIHVFLPTHSYDFEVVKDFNPPVTLKSEPKDYVGNDVPSPKGVPFREEEIEDSISADPQVFDLMKHVNPSPGKSLTNGSDKPLLPSVAADNASPYASFFKADEPIDFDDLEFDFDQGLIDAFSDLIADVNPDDYLDFGGTLTKESEQEQRTNLSGIGGAAPVPVVEEVEEGEILE